MLSSSWRGSERPSSRLGVCMRTPPAEVDIDATLIQKLLHDQFPALAGPVRIVASGWDNVLARVGHVLCVRMPRRALSAPLVQHEADWLPRLAPTLPVDVPAPVAVGQPSADYPWPWLVCPWFEGRRLADVPAGARTAVATQLGAFVSALHRPAPEDAPASPWRGVPLSDLRPRLVERLGQIPAGDAETLRAVWGRCVDAPPHQGPPVWLHGDLHPLNVLVHSDAPPALRAVIDWGDLCRGDPAADLAIAWLGFDGPGRAAFSAAVSSRHPLDDPIWDRALGWAVSLGMLFMLDAEPGTVAYGVGQHLLGQLRLDGDAS
jgi:aminoglycoside phosphotransferase (APT) family kinase protein